MAADFFKVRVWVVIGPHNAGKSSVIGAMISQPDRGGRGGTRHVLLRGAGWLQIQAFKRSIQEAGRSPSIEIAKVLTSARARQSHMPFAFYNILMALRSDSYSGLPIAETYLAEFVKAGWIIESMVLLDIPDEYDRYAKFGAPTALVYNTAENTAKGLHRNWVFGEVRNHFGWA